MRKWLEKEVGRAPTFYAVLVIVLVSCAAYANSLDNGFHFDDSHHIAGNPYLRDFDYAKQYFHRPDMFSALPGHDMYRPLVLWTYALNYSTGGYDPLHWRLTAIALHAFTAVGVFLTFRVLAGRFAKRPGAPGQTGALVAALLFAVHPVFTETVNYASARSSLLASCALLWSFYFHQRALGLRAGTRRVAAWSVSLLLFAAALLSKEIAIVFPALLLWAAFLQRRGYLAILPSVCVALLYLFVRGELLGAAVIDFGAREAAQATADPGSGGARPILWNLYTQSRVVGSYVMLFLAPFGLSPNRHVRVSETPFEAGVIAGALLIAGLLAAAWRWRGSRPMASLGIVWFLVALAPTSSIIPLNQVMNEHRLYAPGIGVALVAGAFLPRRHPALAAAAVTLLLLTAQRNLDWGDPVRLWREAVAVSPDSDGCWNSLGAQLRKRGDLEEARGAFERALELNPRSWDAAFNMGTLHLVLGRQNGSDEDLVEARRWLERSLEIRPHAERSRWFLAEVLYATGRLDKAASAFRDLAGLHPRLYEMTRYPLARICLDQGDLEQAEMLYGEALAHGSDPVAALLGMGGVALRRGDRRAAAAAARRAMEARPHSAGPHLFLARLHKGTALAVRHLFEAERRGYRPTADERRSILGGRGS